MTALSASTFFAAAAAFMNAARILDVAHALRAAHGDRLQVLRAHHRADAGAAGGAMQVVDDGGEQHPRLAGAPDAGNADQRILVLLLEDRLGVPGALAPDLVGGEQLRLVVLDVQVDRLRRLALEDDHVPAGEAQLGAEIAARVRAGDRAGERALGDDRVARAGGGHRAGQRAGGEDQLVRGRQRIDLRIDLLAEVLGGETALAQVFLRPFHVQRFRRAGALGEVHPQNLALPGHDGPPSGVRLRCRASPAHWRMRSRPVQSAST